jgi:uncharacterized membrane protein YqjE
MNLNSLKDIVFKILNLENWINNISGFIEARVELLKLEIKDDVARLLGHALVYGAMMMSFFLVLIFLSIGLAHWVGVLAGASYIGYWAVAGFYGFISIIFLMLRKTIHRTFEKHLSELISRKRK